MSKAVDFIESNLLNFTTIIRPETKTQGSEKRSTMGSIKI